MKRLLLISFVLFSVITDLKASHIVGGEMYYDCLGGTQYRITVKLYRDCASTGAAYDNPLPITVFNGNDVQIDHFTIPFPGSTVLPVVFNNPCVTIPSGICVEEAIYQQIVTLPASPNGYTLSYQRCCRGPAVTNLSVPEDQGLTLTVQIPPAADALCNNSPRFNNYPPLLLCAGQELVFNHSATDPDGDVIVYELVQPFQGGTSLAPAPDPAAAPSYASVVWGGGYSQTVPFGAGSPISINSSTGLLTATPSVPGLYVVGVAAKEYRAGILLSTTVRDFLFKVMNCEVQLEAEVVPQTDLTTFVSYCQGLTIDFENDSYGGTNYAWTVGVAGTTADVSTAFAPSYTFPSAGTYNVTLIVNPGWPCTDTSVETFIINEEIIASFVPPPPQCITDNSFNFNGQGQFPAVGSTFMWEFGETTNPDSAFTEDVSGVVFADYGYRPVTFTVFYDVCEISYTDSVFVYAEPEVGFTVPDELRCAPYSLTFTDTSFAHTQIYYEWNFGDGSSLSPLQNPTHTYPNPGVYDVTLTIWTDAGCIDTLTLLKPALIEVFPSPVSAFTVSPEEATVFNPHFYFSDESIDSQQHYYYFTDGTLTAERFVWHSFVESGYHYPYQVVINQYGCPDTSYQQIYVIPFTTIFVPNAFTPNGDGNNEVWRPVVYNTEAYEIWVFDRWGQVILNSTDELASWDGTMNGKASPVGVYTYFIKYIDHDTGLPYEIRGHFSLVR
ncbi:MAG: gliding motility-associated C-terminal domain-containing protein [Crocinitomicaceae bacterium]|nr:gliding motility-associated C-terminal domain-containing protein [Crocinitomicaceae bacterium]